MAPMDYSQRGYQAVLVGLANSEVHIYCEKFLVHVIKTEDIVTGMYRTMWCGYGRGNKRCSTESTVLVLKRASLLEIKG